ncbi:MAG TPA: DUF3135 domain-containing protein [Candidatus Moranbacteria bacterium]|nr:DUF3135 domain-containing protein [Candidatus Moranbacteria bacterium]
MINKNLFTEEAQKRRREEALEKHRYMAKLFREDRLAFERERKRLIREVINNAQSQELKEELTELQAVIDKRMKGAKNKYNRLIIIRMMLMDQVNQKFLPLLRGFQSASCNIKKKKKPTVTLCQKKEK